MQSPIKVWRQNFRQYQNLGKTGRIVSFTCAAVCSVIVEFEDGQKTVGQLVSESEAKIGAKVIGVLRRIETEDCQGIVEYGIKFKTL